jgi:C_GCAxxG_C_C family probable redox protein
MTGRQLRNRATSNLLRMGHCAPTVVQTLLDASSVAAPELVRMAAGLPGGIGNTGAECGGITGSLLMVGIRHAHDPEVEGLPRAIYIGQDLVRQFQRYKGTLLCRDILGHARIPLRCVGVVRDAPGICLTALSCKCADAIPAGEREAYRQLHDHFQKNRFHCAHAVLSKLRDTGPAAPGLLDATSLFVGGTVFMGMTCSALTAGVIALGAAVGRIESSRLRVLRMIATMAVGGDASRDERNAFNPSMNRGHRLSQWFTREFGSTQCRAITDCDFSTVAGVERYVARDTVARCRAIADGISARVRDMIRHETKTLSLMR